MINICKYCEKEYESLFWSKYCSRQCSKYYNRDKIVQRYQSNLDLREKKNEYERERRKRVGRKRDKKKHAEDEKNRYRRKNKIITDLDLKKAPKGSGCITKHGYKKIHKKGHPNSWKNGDIFEHVFIMAEYLKRPIRKGETIHHKNGIKNDNRIENLELWSNSHPYGQRVEDKINWCKEFLASYGFKVIMDLSITTS